MVFIIVDIIDKKKTSCCTLVACICAVSFVYIQGCTCSSQMKLGIDILIVPTYHLFVRADIFLKRRRAAGQRVSPT